MARLIDAEALREAAETCRETTGDFRALIDAAPTVDAIPMCWITEKFLDVLNKDKELSKAVWLVLYEWQKEAEKLGIQPKEG